MNLLNTLRSIHGAMHEKIYSNVNFKKMKDAVIAKQKINDLHILNIDDTLTELEKGKSMCRFGDGEMEIIDGGEIGFQEKNTKLGTSLANILKQYPTEQCLICVPDALANFDNLTETSLDHWVRNMTQHFDDWRNLIHSDAVYGTTNVTRCYMRYKDKTQSLGWFKRLHDLWTNQNVVMVEGEETRFGVGNDMLDNAKSVQRILCPSENAFDKYSEIREFIENNITTDHIILVALGPTATLLAWDLANRGRYRVLDVGHCDIEYSWCRMGVTKKVAVEGKYTNEVLGGNQVDSVNDSVYEDEVIVRII